MSPRAGALNGLSILVVAETADGPGALSLALFRAGARVVNVATADAGIGVLARLEPEAVIADISAGPGVVFDLLARVRRAGFRTPFIAVSGAHDIGLTAVTLDDFAAILRTPIDHDVLVISVLSVTKPAVVSAGSLERITEFLVGTSPAQSCDACIAQHIRMERIAVRRVTTKLTFHPQFSRRKTRCSTCGRLRAATRAQRTGEDD